MKITQFDGYIEFYDVNDKDKAKESTHQKRSILYLRHNFPDWLSFHVKNEGIKSGATSVNDQQEGVLSGVSDILIITGKSCKYPFIAIELKRSTKAISSTFKKQQREFLQSVSRAGGFAALCYGEKAVKAAIKHALGEGNED